MDLKPRCSVRAAVLPALLAAALQAGPVMANIVSAPEPASPPDGATVASLGPALRWSLPAGTTQYHLQITPFNSDGPGVNLIFGTLAEGFVVPAPPQWYGLLPDMTYSWRLRAGDADTGMGEDNGRWGPWSAAYRFRTPVAPSSSIDLVSPDPTVTVTPSPPT